MHKRRKVKELVTTIRLAVIAVFLVLFAVQGALAQSTVVLPDYSTPLLTPASQAPTAWTNVIPNALAPYFTYVPYTTADAVKLGFPASCGNVAKGDTASTEDCYTITVKSFNQQLALPGIFNGGEGLLDANGNVFGPVTRVYGYGSGGINWSPPGAPGGVTVTGNAPAAFVATGIWHFPAPTLRGTEGRPIRVQWLNELPNVMPDGFDPTVNCDGNAPYCFPYNRIVTHVHGAHVSDDSDGYARAWFTPGFAITGPGWAPSQWGPEGTYRYPMTQEACTIWYHDHAMGVTHNNTQMGMAGFVPISDDNEKALIAANVLPTGNFELGFALQDRMFNINGQFAMPDYPVYDLNSPGCTLTVDGLADPATCKRLDWMKDPADGHLVPWVDGHPWTLLPINLGGPFPAASTTLEYFGNMPVVNGVTYGTYTVEARRYRMRFIGGTDSRTWIMKLVSRTTGSVIPFWQIASEQGFLNNPVMRQDMDLMPGERLDVIVDFTGIPAGTKVVMQNIGPDAPYAGPDMLLDPLYVPSVDIPEIMEFSVIAPSGPDPIIAPSAATNLRPVIGPIVPLVPTPGLAQRNVALEEIVDQYGRTMPTIDQRGFFEPGVIITEVVNLNDTEVWNIINTTVDAHPMHLHLVAFQTVGRQAINTFVSAVTDTVNGDFTQAQYTGTGPIIPPTAWEAGFKDTVDCPPGMVTTVIAKFDIAGSKYVWHCHILSHEEHDMMRPLQVTGTATLNFSAGTCGSITGVNPQAVVAGLANTPQPVSSPVTAVPNVGYHFVNWTGTGGFVTTTANPVTFTVTQDMTITANCAIDTFIVTAISTGNGTITPASQTVNYNSTAAFTVTPDPHYHIASVTSTCGGTLAGNTFTTGPVTANCAVTANFAIDTFAVNFIAGTGGSITGTLNQVVPYGGSATAVTAVANAGYHFVNWTGTGGFVTTTANPLTVTNVTAAMTITANFALNVPISSVTPPSLAFGNQLINTASPPQTVTVANVGAAPMIITGINVTGANRFQFAQTSTCPIAGAGLAPGAACTVSVTFKPTTVGAKSATLAVNVSAPALSQTVALTGTGVSPKTTVSPTSLSFGNVKVGTTSTAQTVTLSNTGTATLFLKKISIVGWNPAQFAQTSTCPIDAAGIAPGASCTISVTFKPTSKGSKSATLFIDANVPALDKYVALSGKGI